MQKATRGPSMHDVAARAGVSHQTVSRVLNDFPGIRPATRERVLEAITELGYRRNLAARTLATGRSQAIGVIFPETPNFGPMSSLYAIQRSALNANFHPLVTTASHSPAAVLEALEFLLGRSIEALVVMAQHPGVVDVVERMVPPDLPTVFVMTGHPRAEHAVAVDQIAGTRLALDHLYQLGHRRIQHIAGPTDFSEARLRREAFAAFVAEHSLEAFPDLQGDWSAESGYQAALRTGPGVTAIASANDQMAQGAIHALTDRGLRVPEDISIVGFDDIPESAHFRPPLTTIHQDFPGVGDQAIAVLVARLRGEGATVPAPLRPWIVRRASTAPPPASGH